MLFHFNDSQYFHNLEQSKENFDLSQPKKQLRKNLAFVGYKSLNLDYRGKNCPVK
jgi:hypothetical protein